MQTLPRTKNSNVPTLLIVGVLGILLGGGLAYLFFPLPPQTTVVAPALVTSPFIYTFATDGVVEEAGESDASRSPYFWLNSGGRLTIENGIGKTIQGVLPESDRWYQEYKESDSKDTDEGARPQNIFRLLTRSNWKNPSVSVDFYITADNFSESNNRNASNGVLFMSRYQDGNHLYYAGVRVDGTAVIKKKYGGIYHTLAQQGVFPGAYKGEQDERNLLPHGTWVSLRMDTETTPDSSVVVRLFMRTSKSVPWKLLLEVVDRGQYAATLPIGISAPVGIRTDFMDVQFRNFRVEEISS